MYCGKHGILEEREKLTASRLTRFRSNLKKRMVAISASCNWEKGRRDRVAWSSSLDQSSIYGSAAGRPIGIISAKRLHAKPQQAELKVIEELCIAPKDYQLHASANIQRARAGYARGLLLGDDPGNGKRLPAMIECVRLRRQADRFSAVVVPASCIDQWSEEFRKFFKPNTVKVRVIRDATIPPQTIVRSDVVIVSYGFMMYQYRKQIAYLRQVGKWEKKREGETPTRPMLSILSEVFLDGVHGLTVVFDECNAIKNRNSLTHAAAVYFWSHFEACLLLTGSPIDNTWDDPFGLYQVMEGHQIRNFQQFRKVFGVPDDKYK
ncbi:P-loop containing nucleoside triphosphate hydrolase protein [Paraphoma chrysanthemicola]|uniref:P-loop containing nucleoside triphosphate hydrolase protein n=1 Tax=Paraphoma chrysanthemicola TaxID=798071 RepID=A0A8K0QXE9_9PLEO|nr:P-loop containing nucleoside triphosphate hydrolase protein [Paraphoma chrysanthemicola]